MAEIHCGYTVLRLRLAGAVPIDAPRRQEAEHVLYYKVGRQP